MGVGVLLSWWWWPDIHESRQAGRQSEHNAITAGKHCKGMIRDEGSGHDPVASTIHRRSSNIPPSYGGCTVNPEIEVVARSEVSSIFVRPVGVGVTIRRVTSFSNETVVICTISRRRLRISIHERMVDNVEVISCRWSDDLTFCPVRITVGIVHDRPLGCILRWFQDNIARNAEQSGFDAIIGLRTVSTDIDIVRCMGLKVNAAITRDINFRIVVAEVSVDTTIRRGTKRLDIYS